MFRVVSILQREQPDPHQLTAASQTLPALLASVPAEGVTTPSQCPCHSPTSCGPDHASQHEAYLGGFHRWGTPKWMVDFIENPIKIDD